MSAPFLWLGIYSYIEIVFFCKKGLAILFDYGIILYK